MTDLTQLENEILADVAAAADDPALETVRVAALGKNGTITALLANDVLRLARSGTNRVEIGGQQYRFVRSFTHFEDRGAAVFSAK